MTEPDRERLLEGTKFNVDRVAVPRRSGGTTPREVIVHPGAVVVLPILDDGSIVLIRNHRFAIDETLWELPAGTLDPDDGDPSNCAHRELREETGYEAREIEHLLTFYSSPGICDEVLHAYVARGLVHKGAQLEETERIETHPLEEERVREMMASAEIRDAKKLVALHHHFVSRA